MQCLSMYAQALNYHCLRRYESTPMKYKLIWYESLLSVTKIRSQI